MGKVTFSIEDQVEEDLRQYVADNFPQDTYGQLSRITNEAIKFWLIKFAK